MSCLSFVSAKFLYISEAVSSIYQSAPSFLRIEATGVYGDNEEAYSGSIYNGVVLKSEVISVGKHPPRPRAWLAITTTITTIKLRLLSSACCLLYIRYSIAWGGLLLFSFVVYRVPTSGLKHSEWRDGEMGFGKRKPRASEFTVV